MVKQGILFQSSTSPLHYQLRYRSLHHERYHQYRSKRAQLNISKVVTSLSNVTVGCLSLIPIPGKIFEELAQSSEALDFEIQTIDENGRLTQVSWIKYSQEIGRIQVFPLRGNEGNFRFSIVPLIRNQAIDYRFFIDINVTRDDAVYMHQVTFKLGIDSYRMFRNLELRTRFVKTLVTYFRSLGLIIRRKQIQIIESDSTSGNLVWRVSSDKTKSGCNEMITRYLPQYLMGKNGKPNKNLLAAFSDENSDRNLYINHVSIDLVPPCVLYNTEDDSESKKMLTATLIGVIVLVVLGSPVVVALLIRYRMKRKRAQRRYTPPSAVQSASNTANNIFVKNHVDHTHPCQFETKSSNFSCWIFRKKGKSYKMNRKLRGQKQQAQSNIFDPKYLQRERLSYSANTRRKSAPRLSETYATGFESAKKSLSIASSNPSYSTSQETYHSGFSRRPSPTYLGPTPCTQNGHHHKDKYRQHQNTESMDGSRSSLTTNNVRTSTLLGSNNNRQTSVHLINIRPKTVNIQTQHHDHFSNFSEQSPRFAGSSQRRNSSSNHHRNAQQSPTRNSPRHQKHRSSPRHQTVQFSSSLNLENEPRRHSDDSALREVHLKNTPERAVHQQCLNIAHSAILTPTKQYSTRKHGSLNHLSTQNNLNPQQDQQMVRSFDHIHNSQNHSHLQHQHPQQRQQQDQQQQQYHQHPQHQQQHQQQQPQKQHQHQPQQLQQHHQLQQERQPQHQTTETYYKEDTQQGRKTSLAKRQEFASRGKCAIELCSYEESQNLHSHVTIFDYEDAV